MSKATNCVDCVSNVNFHDENPACLQMGIGNVKTVIPSTFWPFNLTIGAFLLLEVDPESRHCKLSNEQVLRNSDFVRWSCLFCPGKARLQNFIRRLVGQH